MPLTIHDVAQVVGAGYSISHEAGDAATLIKLMRVAMLLPVVALAAWLSQRHQRAQGEAGTGSRPPQLPWFAVAFAVLVAIHSTGLWTGSPWRSASNGTVSCSSR
ncbi:putative sulfate exporter family transporter [Cupriavidus necator]|uniref:putative sulfate exporter family transporter n=1 Tax=Cupriavidus necator TaxID=106590 RepID=UPI0022AB3E32|nr:putative sulfate exporter family transporter [Cupriavidus necator]